MNSTEQEIHEAELRALKAMFETDGWQIFIREQASTATELRSTAWNSITTIEQLNHMKGFLGAVESIVNYENLIEVREAQFLAQPVEE